MKQQRKTYTKEFKLEAIRLYESSQKRAAQIEVDLELPTGIIHKWRQRYKGKDQAALWVRGSRASLRRPARSGTF